MISLVLMVPSVIQILLVVSWLPVIGIMLVLMLGLGGEGALDRIGGILPMALSFVVGVVAIVTKSILDIRGNGLGSLRRWILGGLIVGMPMLLVVGLYGGAGVLPGPVWIVAVGAWAPPILGLLHLIALFAASEVDADAVPTEAPRWLGPA